MEGVTLGGVLKGQVHVLLLHPSFLLDSIHNGGGSAAILNHEVTWGMEATLGRAQDLGPCHHCMPWLTLDRPQLTLKTI